MYSKTCHPLRLPLETCFLLIMAGASADVFGGCGCKLDHTGRFQDCPDECAPLLYLKPGAQALRNPRVASPPVGARCIVVGPPLGDPGQAGLPVHCETRSGHSPSGPVADNQVVPLWCLTLQAAEIFESPGDSEPIGQVPASRPFWKVPAAVPAEAAGRWTQGAPGPGLPEFWIRTDEIVCWREPLVLSVPLVEGSAVPTRPVLFFRDKADNGDDLRALVNFSDTERSQCIAAYAKNVSRAKTVPSYGCPPPPVALGASFGATPEPARRLLLPVVKVNEAEVRGGPDFHLIQVRALTDPALPLPPPWRPRDAIVLVLDTTFSMNWYLVGSKLARIQTSVDDFVRRLTEQRPDRKNFVGLIRFSYRLQAEDKAPEESVAEVLTPLEPASRANWFPSVEELKLSDQRRRAENAEDICHGIEQAFRQLKDGLPEVSEDEAEVLVLTDAGITETTPSDSKDCTATRARPLAEIPCGKVLGKVGAETGQGARPARLAARVSVLYLSHGAETADDRRADCQYRRLTAYAGGKYERWTERGHRAPGRGSGTLADVLAKWLGPAPGVPPVPARTALAPVPPQPGRALSSLWVAREPLVSNGSGGAELGVVLSESELDDLRHWIEEQLDWLNDHWVLPLGEPAGPLVSASQHHVTWGSRRPESLVLPLPPGCSLDEVAKEIRSAIQDHDEWSMRLVRDCLNEKRNEYERRLKDAPFCAARGEAPDRVCAALRQGLFVLFSEDLPCLCRSRRPMGPAVEADP